MNDSKKHSRLLNGWVMAAGTVVVAILALVGIFIVNNRPPHIPIPTPKMPKVNGYDDFVLAVNLNEKIRHRGPLSDPNWPAHVWTRTEYESFMTDNAPVFKVLKDGLKKPYLHPPLRGLSDEFPRYAMFRELARTTASAGMYYESIGEPGKAADSYLDGIEFGVTLPRGGRFITALVGSAIERINYTRFDPLISKLSPAELAKVANRMEIIEKKRVPYSDILIEDSWSDASWWQAEFRKNGLAAHPKDLIQASTSVTDSRRVLPNLRYILANKTDMLRKNLAYYQAVANEQKKPYTGKSSIPVPDNPLVFGIMFARARASFETNKTIFVVLQTEVALRRYLAANGRYPDHLSELTPSYLKSEPIDPFGIKPLKYKSLKNGRDFLLYSIGPNLQDDHGKPGSFRGIFQSGDIVAGKCWD